MASCCCSTSPRRRQRLNTTPARVMVATAFMCSLRLALSEICQYSGVGKSVGKLPAKFTSFRRRFRCLERLCAGGKLSAGSRGEHLLYCVVIDGAGGLSLSAAPLDSTERPELLLQGHDDPPGWRDVCNLVGAMETHQIKSLRRPIEVGTPGEDNSWVIG